MSIDKTEHLRALLRAELAENAERLRLKNGAAPDVTHRLLKAGVTITADRLVMPCGRSPIDYVEQILRPEIDGLGGGYLFEPPATDAPPAPRTAKPAPAADVSTPAAAAKTRARRHSEVMAKLARANGEDV